MNQTTAKLEELSKKIVVKIQNLRDKRGQSGTLKYFEDFDQVERFGDALWENGLKTNYVSELLDVNNRIKNERDWSKIKSDIPSLSQKLQFYASKHETVQNLKNVLDAAIQKVQDKKDSEILAKLVDAMADLVQKIVRNITQLQSPLKDYPIRRLVKDMAEFGSFLKARRLNTNQIRKFLDAVNNLKLEIELKIKEKKSDQALLLVDFPKIDAALVLLKQKIAYASAKQKAVKPLKEVMDAAIDQVKDSDDFERFFQLVESIIAYHKAAGGE
jgi:CRISPR-associated protein Csm2